MSKILIAGMGFSFIKEPRIINQILALKNNRLIGLGDETNSNLSFFYCIKNWQLIERLIKLSTPFGFRFRYYLFKSYLKFRVRNIDVNDVSLIVANNLENGLIATIMNKPFIFDSHEYLIGQYPETNLWWKLENSYLTYVLNKVLPKANLVTAEGHRVLEQYESIFSLSRDKLMCVPNTPNHIDIKNIKNDDGYIKFIHHGLASPRRGLDIYISIFKKLPENYTLTLMLNNVSHPYYKFLVDLASNSKNINFIPPVPYDQIVTTISRFDGSLVFFNSNNFHHRYMTVPNKFWESLQARLPVVVSFESAMADIIKQYDAGFICQGLELDDYLSAIQNIGHAEIKRCRKNISKNAINFSNESWMNTYNNQVDKIIDAKLI